MLLGACAPPSAPAHPGERNILLLVGWDAFAGGTRAARLLDDMVASTGVLGTASFEIAVADSPWPDTWAGQIEGRKDLRAVIAVAGGLSLLPGVGPHLGPRPVTERIRRDIDLGRLRAGLDDLGRATARAGAVFIPATAPLGRQGRVEVPELLDVEAVVRGIPGHLDLASDFRRSEDVPRFRNGIDQLDDYGHDALARFVFEALVQHPGIVTARDDEERAARLQARTLAALARGDTVSFHRLARLALADESPSPDHAVRLAAIDMAHRGLNATQERWAAVVGDTPGIIAGRLLTRLPIGSARTADPVDAGLARIATALQGPSPVDARDLALQLVEGSPHRVETWIVLHLVNGLVGSAEDVRAAALRQLALFDDGAVGQDAARELLASWPATLESLPALLAASRPFLLLQPTGPALNAARRRVRLGYVVPAHGLLARAMAGGLFPPNWHQTLRELDPGR